MMAGMDNHYAFTTHIYDQANAHQLMSASEKTTLDYLLSKCPALSGHSFEYQAYFAKYMENGEVADKETNQCGICEHTGHSRFECEQDMTHLLPTDAVCHVTGEDYLCDDILPLQIAEGTVEDD